MKENHEKQLLGSVIPLRKLFLTMKFTVILLLVSMLHVSAKSFAQSSQLSVNYQQVSVEQIFADLEKNSDYSFVYRKNDLFARKAITYKRRDSDLFDILEDVLDQQNLTYKVNDRIVIILPKGKIDQQDDKKKTVEGVVTDENGEPLPGVAIMVKGTSNGVATNLDGKYKIFVTNENAILSFSFVGMETKEVAVDGQKQLNVVLKENTIGIDEVVAIGYGTTTKQNLTTSVVSIKTKDIPKAANTSVNQLLFGRASGLNAVQASAEPGGNINLSIRGRGNPLIIVDGIVMPSSGLEADNSFSALNGVKRGGLGDINPSDIESIEVLKDASAAIYGVAAADGVILITTKKGKKGNMRVSYDGNISIVQNLGYLKPLNATEYMQNYNQLSRDAYLFSKEMVPFGNVPATGFTPKYSESDIASAGSGTDWLNQVLRTGSVNNHNVNINGGTDRVTYYFSGNYFDQKGTVKNSDMSRYKTSLNMTYKMTDFIKFNASFGYTRSKFTNSQAGWQGNNGGIQTYGALQAAAAYPSTIPVRDADGNYSNHSVIGNPTSLLDITDQSESSAVRTNLSVDIDIIKDKLSAKFLYGNNLETASRNFFIPSYVKYEKVYQSRGSLGKKQRQNQTMEATFNYTESLFDAIKLNAVGGYGEYIYDEEGLTLFGSDMLDTYRTDNFSIVNKDRLRPGSSRAYEKKRSYFLRTNFDILDKYLVSLVYRLDGIDKFFPDNKYEGFPSVSLGWKMHNESFLQEFDALTLLKLRTSYGITGRPIGSVAYGEYRNKGVADFSNAKYVYPMIVLYSQDEPSLKWEKTQNFNAGLDFAFLKNRFSGSFEYFYDEVSNLLNDSPTAQLSPLFKRTINDGKRVRSGWEASFKSVNIAKSDFQWETVLNLSSYNYKWKKRFENAGLSAYVKEDDEVNAVYVYETNGILQVGETPSAWQPANASLPGSPKFVDQNGDGKLDDNDVVKYSGDPKLIFGIGNNLKYKNFDLSFFLYGHFGAYGINNTRAWADAVAFTTGATNATTDIKNAWSTTNPEGKWPGVVYDEGKLGLNASSDVLIEKKDFLRCRNITLGYTLNNSILKKYVSNLRIYLDVQNPFLVTKYSVGDPEVQTQAIKGAAAPYPMARTYSLGINVNF